MTQQICLCIHGHFYQPPRNNPWIEALEYEPSAAPHHDWNERVHHECYRPNTRAQLLAEDGVVADIVNNFETLSFNVGPTLMSWLESRRPATYRRIVEADRLSVAEHGGRGNAIAQVYNHMIMPLANGRDKVTQVRWGVADFRKRFGREPEGMWLAETAADGKTLEALIGEGIRFTILSPEQARCVRPMVRADGGWAADMPAPWYDVSGGGIDPRQPYRWFSSEAPGKYLDIFFYDGPVSKALGGGNLCGDPKLFMARLEGARDPFRDGAQLVHVATDGEVFGHHKPFGERTLAHLLRVEARERGWRIVNYGEYLDENPPCVEVRIKAGPDGEGTAWSCEHGVRRWRDHCGCRGHGPAEWNQQWRRPLRQALDGLRDELAAVFEREGGAYLKDVWEARDDYIGVVLDRSEPSLARFLDRHAVRPLALAEKRRLLRILEMQRHAMLMYTSCGWFFTELSGPETSQILQYAARAMQLCREACGRDLEAAFLERFGVARSNIALYGDGRGVYGEFVTPRIASFEKIVFYHAAGGLFGWREQHMECFDLKTMSRRHETRGGVTLDVGRVRLRSRITLDEGDYGFALALTENGELRCSVKPTGDVANFEAAERELFEDLRKGQVRELFGKLDRSFGGNIFRLNDLLPQDGAKIIDLLARQGLEKAGAFCERLFDDSRRLCELYREFGLKIPTPFWLAAEAALNRWFVDAALEAAGEDYAAPKLSAARQILDDANRFGVRIDTAEAARVLTDDLKRRVRDVVKAPLPQRLAGCLNLLRYSREAAIAIDVAAAQEQVFMLVKSWREDADNAPASVRAAQDLFAQLAQELKLKPCAF